MIEDLNGDLSGDFSEDDDGAASGSTPGTLHGLIYAKPGHLIRRLQQFAAAIFIEETAPFELTPVQYAILAGVRAHPGIDQISLARLIGFDRTTMGGVIDRLEKKGLVERRLSSSDRRIRLLYPTVGGVDLLSACYPAAERAQARMLEPLTPDEAATFKRLMGRIVAHQNASTRAPIDPRQARAQTNESGDDA